MHTRNIQERKRWADSYGQMSLVFMQADASYKKSFHSDAKEALGENYDHHEVEQSRLGLLNGDFKIDFDPMDPHFLGTTLTMSEDLYRILAGLKKIVLVSADETASTFVTSDNPVTHYAFDNEYARRYGLGYVNAIFQMPISPTRCLLLINKDLEVESFEYDSEAIDYINFYTYYYADRWIFSHNNSKKIAKMFETHRAKGPLSSVHSPFSRTPKS